MPPSWIPVVFVITVLAVLIRGVVDETDPLKRKIYVFFLTVFVLVVLWFAVFHNTHK